MVKKIEWLHRKVGSKEWSGELITREEGTINDLDSWKIVVEDIFLADIGSPGFTGYEVDKGSFKSSDIVELYDAYPDLMEGKLKLQHIHTHHSMAAFFSGTDWENLEDRSTISNYFLMLIVNFDGKWCAKVGFKAEKAGAKSIKLSFKNNSDGFKPLSIKEDPNKDVLVVMNCNIEKEVVEDDMEKAFADRYNKVRTDLAREEEEKRKAAAAKQNGGATPRIQGKLPFGGDKGDWWDPTDEMDEWYKDSNGIWTKEKKPKKISDMTDKEWADHEQAEEAAKVFQKDQLDVKGKFELRHAKALINSIIDNTYSPYDFSDCIKKLEEEDKSLLQEADYDRWLDQFVFALEEHFDTLFIDKTDDDYVQMLEMIYDYLLPYKRGCELIVSLLDSIDTEIELNKETA